MVTLSTTEARINLSSLLKRAARGEDIGIVCDGKIIALRPVQVTSTDYLLREYGVTSEEMKRFAKRNEAQVKKDRKAGKTRKYTGNIEDLVRG